MSDPRENLPWGAKGGNMEILEPILFTGENHTVVAANTQENEELDFDLSFNSGVLLIACRPDFADTNIVTFSDALRRVVVALRTTGSLAADINDLTKSLNTVWMSVLNVQEVLDTAVGGQAIYFKSNEWMELPGGGVVVASNPFAEFRHTGAGAVMTLGVAYKRVIFSEDELVRLVALRR